MHWLVKYSYDIAGTTRDSIDTKFDRFGFEFNLVDTAGIRRSESEGRFEFYSVMRSVRAIEIPISVFDYRCHSWIWRSGKVFWFEKNRKLWFLLTNDLVEKETMSTRDYEENQKN
jgi:GTP-binding protein